MTIFKVAIVSDDDFVVEAREQGGFLLCCRGATYVCKGNNVVFLEDPEERLCPRPATVIGFPTFVRQGWEWVAV